MTRLVRPRGGGGQTDELICHKAMHPFGLLCHQHPRQTYPSSVAAASSSFSANFPILMSPTKLANNFPSSSSNAPHSILPHNDLAAPLNRLRSTRQSSNGSNYCNCGGMHHQLNYSEKQKDRWETFTRRIHGSLSFAYNFVKVEPIESQWRFDELRSGE